MAFALVQPIQDHRYLKSCIIPSINIKNYSKSSHKPDIKYLMKLNDNDSHDTQGIVYDTDDSIELLKKLLKKRLRKPTLSKCHTNLNDLTPSAEAPGDSEASGGRGKKRTTDTSAKPVPQKKVRVKKSQTLKGNERFDPSKIEEGRLRSKKTSSHSQEPSGLDSGSSSKQRNGSFDFLSTPAINTPKPIDELETATSKGSPSKCHEVSESSDAEANGVPEDINIVSRAINDTVQEAEALIPHMQESEKTTVSRQKGDDINETGSRATCGGDTNLDKSMRDGPLVQKLKKDISEKNKIIAKQNKTIEEYARILKDRDDMIKDLTRCNIDLQRSVIDNFFQLHDIVRDLKQSKPETVSSDGSHLSIGYLNRLNFKVHVGRNEWVEQKTWQYLFSLTKPSEFVRELARPLFGDEVLMKSTVKGRGSNRSGRGNIKQWDRLDPVKVEAIRDALNHFLKCMKFRDMPAAEKANHVHSVTDYLQSFISDLKGGKITAQVSKTSEKTEVDEEKSEGGGEGRTCEKKGKIPRQKKGSTQNQTRNPDETAESVQKRGEKEQEFVEENVEKSVEESEYQCDENKDDGDKKKGVKVSSAAQVMGESKTDEDSEGVAGVGNNLESKQEEVQNGEDHDCTKSKNLASNKTIEDQKEEWKDREESEGEEHKREYKIENQLEEARKSYKFPIEVSSDDDDESDGDAKSVLNSSLDRNDTLLINDSKGGLDSGEDSRTSGSED